jgi:curved DNA-binding protein CbpA
VEVVSDLLAPTEILALAKILDELDYYQVLHIRPDASASDVRKAFHASSRAFHPDANRHLDALHREAIGQISKRVTEAYTVLRDAKRRRAYDESLREGQRRMQIAEAEAKAEQQATAELEGTTPNGRRYWTLARTDLARGDLAAALRNLRTALTFEPGNPQFKAKMAELKKQLDEQWRREPRGPATF